MRKYFEKDGPLEWLYPVYDMIETMFFVRPEKTVSGAHIRDNYDIKRMMALVIVACFPAMLFGIYNTGYQYYVSAGITPSPWACILSGARAVLPVYVVVYAVGGFWEVLFALVRRHEIKEAFLVTGFFIPLILPPAIPLWMVAVATSFGVVIGKEVFGGTGMNIFNPALVTRAFIFFAYPASISGDGVWTLQNAGSVDAYTGATPLGIASSGIKGDIVRVLSERGYSFYEMFIGLIPGSVGETSTAAILAGAFLLLVTGVASWRIMLSVAAGGLLTGLVMNMFASSASGMLSLPPHYHLVMGSFAFGAVFMATDPVSASATNAGKYVYGFLIGALTVLIRVVNPAYPEGMMLSVLFMNAFAPVIDNVVIWRSTRRRRMRAQG